MYNRETFNQKISVVNIFLISKIQQKVYEPLSKIQLSDDV